MKKIISLILALLMMFSVTTVAFAEDVTDDAETTTGEVEGDASEAETDDTLQWILDLPFWTVGPALKFAKIALKLVKVYVKLAMIFGVIDKDDIISQIEELIAGAMNSGSTETEEEVTTTAPAEEDVSPVAA